MRKINYFYRPLYDLTGQMIHRLMICLSLLLISSQVWAVIDPLQDRAPQSERAQQGLLLDITQAAERLVTVGERGHILYSDDQGQHWQQAQVPVRVTLTAVDFATAQLGWVVGHDGVILATQDGGVSWQKQLDGYQANQAIEDELKRLLALSDNERLEQGVQYQTEELEYLLEDAQLFSEEGASRPFLDVQFLDERQGFAVGAYGLIFRTVDGGEHWQPWVANLANPDNFHINALTQGRDELYMAGEAGSIYRSDDQGLSWSTLTSPYDGPFFGVAVTQTPSGEESVVVYGLRGHAFISSDRGDHWSELDVDSDAAVLGVSQINGNRIVLLTNGGELYQFSDDGELKGRGLTQDRSALSSGLMATSDDLLLVGVNGMTHINLPQMQWEVR
ncbi:hypothetical protein EH243_17055 [Amphritea opalescens]|uniref:Photosynthesis system II assembly factor Ycf48/Hcf136-like domain-containing protein n=1 Tax=Amphritea opalescens TaxID=2490544 RepID=A0A430KM22_9GAMM|nr:YCF48-related protein [Amphritea opalescens]RTE64527.1 hypothetical protein EH243_17055 [Amphritea opalescens]